MLRSSVEHRPAPDGRTPLCPRLDRQGLSAPAPDHQPAECLRVDPGSTVLHGGAPGGCATLGERHTSSEGRMSSWFAGGRLLDRDPGSRGRLREPARRPGSRRRVARSAISRAGRSIRTGPGRPATRCSNGVSRCIPGRDGWARSGAERRVADRGRRARTVRPRWLAHAASSRSARRLHRPRGGAVHPGDPRREQPIDRSCCQVSVLRCDPWTGC